MSPHSDRSISLWWTVGLGLYAVLLLLVLGQHEMWRDELQAWLIAKESQSLAALWQNSRYEGHPLLWFVTLYGLTRLTTRPEAMQVLHGLLAAISVGVLWRYAPFPPWKKVLLAFGYFFFYEYAVISRNYAQGVLLLLLFLAAYRPSPDKPYALLAVLLALLCQTSIYGLLLALSLVGLLAFELWWHRPPRDFFSKQGLRLTVSGFLVLAAALAALYTMKPPADFRLPYGGAQYLGGLDLARLPGTFAQLWRSYLPVPLLHYQFWETNVLRSEGLAGLLSLWLLGVLLLGFLKKPLALYLYVTGTGVLLAFMHLIYTVSLRHAGHLYLLMVACMWLAALQPTHIWKRPFWERLGRWGERHCARVVAAILAAQVLAAGMASWFDWHYPFSASRQAAAYIRKNGLEDRLLAGDVDFAISPLAAYLDRKLYYFASHRFGSFIVWNDRRLPLTPERLPGALEELRQLPPGSWLVVLNYPLPPQITSLTLKAAFPTTIRWDEGYYLYVLAPQSPEESEPDKSRASCLQTGGSAPGNPFP